MTTKNCSYFIAIARYGSISAAARQLNISAPALSKFLKNLEHQIGMPLFLRYGHTLSLTEAGKIYYQTSCRMLDVKEYTLHAMNRILRKDTHVIRIASTPYRGAELFSRIYNRFTRLFPTASLEVHETFSSAQEQAIHDGIVDIAFGAETHANFSDVMNIASCRVEIVLAVPDFYPEAATASRDLAHLSSIRLDAFRNMPFVLLDQHNNLRLKAEKEFELSGFKPLIVFESANSLVVEAMVRQGAGVGFFSRRYIKEEEHLRFFRLDPPVYETLYIRCARQHRLSDRERCLIAIIADEQAKIRGSQPLSTPQLTICRQTLANQEEHHGQYPSVGFQYH